MILCYLPNGAADFQAQAHEIAQEHWPHHPLAYRNVGRVDWDDLEVEEVEGVILPTAYAELAALYRRQHIQVIDILPRTRLTPPPEPVVPDNPVRIKGTPFSDHLYPDLLQTLTGLPEPKYIALIGCLRSLAYCLALLREEMQRLERRKEVVQILVQRITYLRGKSS